MKKLLLILALIPLFALAQRENEVKEYCSVKYVNRGQKSYAAIMQGDKGFIAISDSTGERIFFNTEIQVINYMSKNGWELHPISISYANSNNGKYYEYIFWRYIKERKGE